MSVSHTPNQAQPRALSNIELWAAPLVQYYSVFTAGPGLGYGTLIQCILLKIRNDINTMYSTQFKGPAVPSSITVTKSVSFPLYVSSMSPAATTKLITNPPTTTLYTIQCSVYSTVYSVQGTLYSTVQYSVQFTGYIVQYSSVYTWL